MKMIKVTCKGKDDVKCSKAYKGCKDQVMYSETDHKIICDNGKLTVTGDDNSGKEKCSS